MTFSVDVTSTEVTVEIQSTLSPVLIQSGGLTWRKITGSSQLLPNNAYAIDSLTLALLDLPEVGVNVGDRILIYLVSGVFRIVQSSGQQCQVNDDLTTVGVTGAIVSKHNGVLLELTYLDPLWIATDLVGNIEIV